MCKQICAFLIFLSVATTVFPAVTVSNVVVDSVRDSAASYGNIWQGFLKYDVSADSAKVWAWVELSTDNGATWSQRQIHSIGHVGSIDAGANRKVWWMVDGDKGPDCRLRVRVNSDPAYYIQSQCDSSIYPNYLIYPTIYMGDADPRHCPIPIPDDEPYALLERMVNKVRWQMDLTDQGYQKYHLPIYEKDIWGISALNPITDLRVDTGVGSFIVGMSKITDPSIYLAAYVSTHFYRCTYLKMGGLEFAAIATNTEGLAFDSAQKICQALQDSMGIPKRHVLITVDHTHYHDIMKNNLGVDSCVAGMRRAKAAAVPGEVAYEAFHLGPGFNFARGGHYWYTNGAVDEKVIALFFRNTATQAPIGCWLRFTGHNGSMDAKLNLAMESRFGGICAFMQGGAGTTNTNCDYNAAKNPGVTKGLYDENTIPDSMAPKIAGLSYTVPDKMGVAWSDANWYTNTINRIGQSFRLGDFYLAAFTKECPAEQQLFVLGRMAGMNVMPVGYANAELPNDYIYWNTGPAQGDFYRQTEAAIRCMNILSHY